MTANAAAWFPGVPVEPGAIIWTWCQQCGDRTDHVCPSGNRDDAICLDCHPEFRRQEEHPQ